jgi:HEAT repeat protein
VRLGDDRGERIVQEMLRSDALETRLYAAEAFDHSRSGPWVDAIMPALADPNGLTRIHAAEALRLVAPAAALPVLRDAAADPNPVVRADVGRVLEKFADPAARPGLDLLRRMLHDADASVRLRAAGAILDRAQRG